ncbi:MAG: serine/threonine-protein kinase [Planctomycetota bacterium]|nr:serine/threonine-protein kinase [Planctomycetota bacterium]
MADDRGTNPDKTDEPGSFGAVAMRLGYINKTQLDEAMKVQYAAAKAGLRKRLGEILMKKGYLTNEQFKNVLKGQTVKRKRIGDYELLAKLGEGGMGSVFKAKQLSMDRTIALKVLSPKMAKDQEFCERFQREARAVAQLNHPHIVSGIDVGRADGYWYFAMEYVDGDSLGQYMHRKGGKLPEAEALEFTRQTALALHHAHQNNQLHRDVKPDNILLDKRAKIAKLVDLGLARSAEVTEDESALTQVGMAVGTPFYISPEQARGRSDLTAATDLYSLGATLYHLLTGQVPFDGATAAVIMTRHLTDPVPSARAVNPEVSVAADRLVSKLMQKDPSDRYADAMQLVKDIERIRQSSSRDESTPVPAPKKVSVAKVTKPAPVAAPSRERERERERDEAPSGGSSHTIPTRGFRRRRRRGGVVGVGVFVVLVLALGAILFVLNPFGPGKARNGRTTQPQPNPNHTKEPPKPQLPAFEPQPTAVPATLQVSADGRKTFIADFEGKVQSFEVDPAIYKGQPTAIVSDATGQNHVLRLAPIRQPYRSVPNQKECGVMARLLLPLEHVFSPNATLSVKVHIGQTADPNPELHVYWDHRVEGKPRAMAGWTFKDPAFRTGWGKLQMQLGQPAIRLQSRETADTPQYISFMAGAPEETIEVYIDDVELVDGAPEPVEPPKTVTPPKTPEKEPPVAPPPPKKTPQPQEKEPPVVPPPKKTDEKGADALHQAI